MSTTIKEQSRFDARLPKEQKQFFERAAYLGGYRNLTEEIGSFAVVVDPIDKEAEMFYEKYDFIKLPDSEKMIIASRTLKELFD